MTTEFETSDTESPEVLSSPETTDVATAPIVTPESIRLRIAAKWKRPGQSDAEVLAKVEEEVARTANTLRSVGSADPESAALEVLLGLVFPPPGKRSGRGSTGRRNIQKNAKPIMQIAWGLGKTEISSAEVGDALRRAGLYHTTSNKGIGDALGKGEHGLNLQRIGCSSGASFRVPDPLLYADWYANENGGPIVKDYK